MFCKLKTSLVECRWFRSPEAHDESRFVRKRSRELVDTARNHVMTTGSAMGYASLERELGQDGSESCTIQKQCHGRQLAPLEHSAVIVVAGCANCVRHSSEGRALFVNVTTRSALQI